MLTRMISSTLASSTAVLAFAASIHAANPNVRILTEMNGELLAASRDGNVLASSAFYLVNSGGGGPVIAPVSVWRRDGASVFGSFSLGLTNPQAVSADGAVIAGYEGALPHSAGGAFAWIAAENSPPESVLRLASPTGTHSSDSVTWLAPDGSTGFGQSGGGYLTRWSGLRGPAAPAALYLRRDGSASVFPGLADLAINCIKVLASDDAALVFGDDFSGLPFTWSASHGYVPLPVQPAWTAANVRAVSPDGHSAAGTAFVAGGTYLVRWSINPATQAATAQALAGPFPASPDVEVHSVRPRVTMTSDAAIIGYNPVHGEAPAVPVLWLASGSLGLPDLTGTGRVVALADYLAAHGVQLTSIDESADGQLVPTEIISISGDGRTFSGNGTIHINDPDLGEFDKLVVWTARLPIPACSPADVAGLGGSNGPDGQLTADDVVVYLSAFFNGNAAVADLTGLGGAGQPDGIITPDDLIAFLTAFFAGCN